MDIVTLDQGDHHIARTVLEALPDWFGRPSARDGYIRRASELPMIAAIQSTEPIGFLSLDQLTERSCEIHVMGVRPELRRNGYGASLVRAADSWCMARGIDRLTVKTVASTVPDQHYVETRAFYRAMGFQLAEVLPDEWAPEIPCAVYARSTTEKRPRI